MDGNGWLVGVVGGGGWLPGDLAVGEVAGEVVGVDVAVVGAAE